MNKRVFLWAACILLVGLARSGYENPVGAEISSADTTTTDRQGQTSAAVRLEPDPWVQTGGPEGGNIDTIEIDPAHANILYAGGSGGAVFKSIDSGAFWTMLPQITNPNNRIYDLLIPAQSPQTVYALAAAGNLYKSSNSGSTWNEIGLGKDFTCIAMVPGQPSRLVAGSRSGKVYRSLNGGDTWTDISGNLPGQFVQDVVTGGENEYWVGTNNDGNGNLYHTTNGGSSWNLPNINLPLEMDIHSLLIDPTNPNIVYVGLRQINNEMLDPQNDTYLLKTTDRGAHWTALHLTRTDAMINLMSISLDGQSIFAASGGSWLSHSIDGGQSWTEMALPGQNGDIYDIATDPQNVHILYLARRTNGILKTYNGGTSWTTINHGLNNVSVSLLTAPDAPGSSTIYASTVSGEGTFRSDDRGQNWVRLNDGGMTHPWTDELTVSPHNPNEVWVTADVAQVFRSLNKGETWSKIIDPRRGSSGFRFGSIYALAPAPSDPDTVYALKNGFGLFKSTDGAGNWNFLRGSEVDYTYSIAVHPSNPNILYSGYQPKPFQNWAMVRKSADGGQTWSTNLTVPDSTGIASVAIDPGSPNRVYAGSTGASATGGGRIYTSGDGGTTWDVLNEHFTMLTVWGQPQLILDPANPSTAYAATWLGGTWKTADAGASWSRLENAPLSSTSLSLDPTNAQVLYSTDRTGPWVWKSTDGGTHWTKAANFSSDGAFLTNRVLAVSGAVYVSTFGPGIHNGKLYRSLDGGATWGNITGSLPRSVLDIAVHPSNPQIVYVTTHVYGAYTSTNGGLSWSQMTAFPNIGGYDIEVDPADPNVVYAAGMGAINVPNWVMPPSGYSLTDSSGIYKSTNGGTSWTRMLATGNEARAVRLHPSNHNLVFAAALDGGLSMSPDGGATWTSFNTGLDTRVLTSLAVAGNRLYVGTQGSGVYSADFNTSTKTVTWRPERSNKPVPDVHSLQIVIDPINGDRIYVGANPGGLFRSDDGGATFYDKNFLTPSVVVDDPKRQGYYTFALNPANPSEVWLGTWGKGIYKSYDGMDFDIGANGTNQQMMGKNVQAMLVHPNYGVLAATENGIYRTTNGGQSWVDFSSGLGSRDIRVLAAGAGGRVYAGSRGYEVYQYDLQQGTWQQMRAFDEYGVSWPIWNDRPLYQYTSLLFHPTDPNILYFGVFPSGIYRSVDRGQTWREGNTGWPNDGVFSLVFHPQNPQIIYAGTYNGVNRSTDGGEHWTTLANGWPAEQWVFSIDFDPRNPSIMYACSKNGENEGTGREDFRGTVMKSVNGGSSWYPITTGLDLSEEFYKIIVDRINPDRIYLASQWDGVYMSSDGGAHWNPWNDGLTNLNAGTNGNNVTNTMLLSTDGLYLYFGSAGSGVFRRMTVRLDNRSYLPLIRR